MTSDVVVTYRGSLGDMSREPRKGTLHCRKFDQWLDVEDVICPRPDDYCEFRDKCGIHYLMTERDRAKKRGDAEESKNAAL